MSTEAKWTPGPWRDRDDSGKYLSDRTDWIAQPTREEFETASALPILDAWGDTVCLVVSYGQDESQQQANARLIAAAPDLLEALKAQTAALIELRDEQISDAIFGGQTTQERRAASDVYAGRIREAAERVLVLIDRSDAAIAKAGAA